MKKVLIIAQNQANVDEGAKHFKGTFLCKGVYPGTKRFPSHYEAVVVFYSDESEINIISDLLTKYKDAPVKVFLGNVAHGGAKSHNAETFTVADVSKAVAYINTQVSQLDEVMQKAFKAFDKDNSGFIDLNELGDVAKELGRPMDAAELEECMRDLDLNKDNKISFQEFRTWWLSGRQGLSRWMRTLLAFKLKAIKFADSVQSTVRSVVEESGASGAEISTSSLSININKVQHAGTSLNAKLMFLSPEIKSEYDRIKSMHKFGVPEEIIQAFVNITIETKDASVETLQGEFEAILNEEGTLPDPSLREMISYVNDGHKKLNIAIAIPVDIESQLAPFADIIDKLQSQMKVDQNIEASIRLAASPKDILADGADPLVMQLVKGISFDFKINLWKRLADVVLKVIESGEIDTSSLPFLAGLAPAFLLKINANLDLEVDDQMKTKITENPLMEPVLVDAGSLIAMTSNVSSDEELDQYLDGVAMPKGIVSLIKFLIKYLGDEITVQVLGKHIGARLRINGDGLNLLVRNAAKFAQ